MKKRITAIILGLSMVFQATAFAAPSASATNTLVLDESTSESETESKDTANEGDTQGSTVNTPTVGEDEDQAEQPQETSVVNFELQLQLDFKIKKETLENLKGLFLVSLQRKESTGEGSGGSHVHAIVKRVEDDLVVFQAEDVAPGEYRLRMETEYYFQDFEQDVTIKQGTKTTLVFSDSYTSYRGEGKVSPGVYALGDLDTDGTIDEKDSKVLLEHIGTNAETVKDPDGTEGQEPGDQDSQDTVSEDPDVQDTSAEEPEGNPPEELVEPSAGYQQIYDLNQDGKLDIGDLGILVYNMGQEKREATPIETVLKTTVKVAETQEKAIPQGERKLDTIMEDAEVPIQIAAANPEAVISEENPVQIEMEFESTTALTGGMVISAPAENGPAAGSITVDVADPTDEDPDATREIVAEIVDEAAAEQPAMFRAAPRAAAKAIRKADGSIVLDLGEQVAIKKVTILVTAAAESTKLTEIAKVEFLNDMASRIPEPEMNIPEEITVDGKGDSFTVSWDPEVNVAGYVVAISAVSDKGVEHKERTYNAGSNQIMIQSFEGGHKNKVTPLWTYSIRVKSVNGEWSSPYSEPVSHYQLTAGPPDAPDNVSANGKYRQLDVSWKDMVGTEKYNLQYRKKGTEEWIEVNDIFTNSYKITDLEDNTEYQVQVRGWNTDEDGNLRHGKYSLTALGKTASEVPIFAKYKMINHPNPDGGLSQHIEAIEPFAGSGIDTTRYPEGEEFKAEYLVDGDYTTYMHTKRGGEANGFKVTFDKEYTIKEFIVTNRLEDQFRDNIGDYSGIQVQAWDENGQLTTGDVRVSMQSLHPTAKNSIRYILSVPVKAKSLRLSMNKYGAYSSNGSTISELNFFEYDSLEQDVYGLYADDMHVTLTEGTMQAEIIELEERANTIDTVSNEYHPKKTVLLSELEFAEKLLADSTIGDIMDLRWEVTKSGGVSGIKFNGGLCALQPLGYVAQVGSTVNIYVGQKGKNVGAALPLRLVFTQYHPESGAWRSGEIALYQGKNEITIPKINSLDYEQGGSLYIVHTDPGGVKANPVQIRVSGATKIPKLDLYRPVGEARRTVDETAWKAAIREYVEELVTYVGNLEASHEEHKEAVEYEYDETNCFLNSTEISLDNVLISVPAKQILSGLVSKAGSSTDIDALTNQMYDTAVAMNQMLELFYKERGLNPTYTYGYQGTPTGRFNIRYHRMFAGAFMYAGGLHLGIEYGSVPGLAAGTPVTADEKGRRTGGQMFGWGIAHEMGHNADGSNFSFAEITNNIWAQFEKSWDTAETTRIPYEKVYKHVTSNTVGKPSSVFASLGMYWQLHLAYDKNGVHYDYYKDDFSNAAYETMLQNEFFARYYAIRREWNRAPKPNGIGLTEGTTEQNIMRTACAAAEKDLTDFFRAWGYEVDSVTAAYAGQFDKETRKIQYLNDAAHEYTLENPDPETGGMSSTSVDVALEQGTGINARKVTLTMSLPAETNMDAVLGYEILRNGKPAAFVMPSKTEDGDYAAETVYEDIIETENNRVMIYEVVAYDNYLNATEKNTQAPIKIRHEGELPRDNWEITTNTVSNAGVLTVYDGTKVTEGNCYQDAATGEDVVYTLDKDVRYLSKETGELLYTETAAARMLDGDKETGYEGTAPSGTASITIALGGRQEVTALAFDGGSTQPWKFLLEYSTNGVNFTRITGFETNTTQDGSPVLYFAQNKNIKSYKATHIRITAPTNVKTIGIKELRLLSPSGDNVDIGVSMVDEENGKETWNTENAIGKLAEDYQLDENNTIPADSFIVTGKYTGNAAYNVVKLYNENHIMHDESNENKRNSIVNGYQTFFAEMPDSGSIVNVKDGTWIYWLEPLEGENAGKYGLRGAGENGADVVVELPTKVYAELYRVDDAMTLAGERLVSDTFTVDVPEELPIISLKGIGSETEGTQPEESGEETQTQAE